MKITIKTAYFAIYRGKRTANNADESQIAADISQTNRR
jgi:hypothetical protein